MLTVSFLFQAMGTRMTTYNISTFVDVLAHQPNLRSDDAKHWGERMKESVAEQQRLHTSVDCSPIVSRMLGAHGCCEETDNIQFR